MDTHEHVGVLRAPGESRLRWCRRLVIHIPESCGIHGRGVSLSSEYPRRLDRVVHIWRMESVSRESLKPVATAESRPQPVRETVGSSRYSRPSSCGPFWMVASSSTSRPSPCCRRCSCRCSCRAIELIVEHLVGPHVRTSLTDPPSVPQYRILSRTGLQHLEQMWLFRQCRGRVIPSHEPTAGGWTREQIPWIVIWQRVYVYDLWEGRTSRSSRGGRSGRWRRPGQIDHRYYPSYRHEVLLQVTREKVKESPMVREAVVRRGCRLVRIECRSYVR